MLREVWRSAPFVYMTSAEYAKLDGSYGFGVNYSMAPFPWVERFAYINGFMVDSRHPTPDSMASTIYVMAAVYANYWPSWNATYWVFDGLTGKMVRRVYQQGSAGSVGFNMIECQRSRKGIIYALHYYHDKLNIIDLGTTATAPFGDEGKVVWDDPNGWKVTQHAAVDANKFKVDPNDPSPTGGPLYGFGQGGCNCWAIDDVKDLLIDASFENFRVFKWSTGEFKYEIRLPSLACTVCLEREDRCYVLLNTNVVILLDYVRGEVLGSARIPPMREATNVTYWNQGWDVQMTWDYAYHRLLVVEQTPDAADGSCTMYIRGFQLVSDPVRLTRPIPLQVPRQGRTIPVLVRVVGDVNEGIGEHPIQAVVTGGGAQVGLPITNNNGDGFIQVKISDPASYDESTTPSGDMQFKVVASVSVNVPPPSEMPVSGVPGPGPEIPGGGTGDPGTGTSPGTNLPEEAPNMMGVLQQVYNSQVWRLEDQYEDEHNGRGAFTEAAVTAFHDQDARWGHIRKNPGQNQYNGHAVDAAIWKNPDGVTAEIVDFLSGNPQPNGSYLTWLWQDRDEENLTKWYY